MYRIDTILKLTLKLVSWIHRVFKLSEIRPIREYRYLVDRLTLIEKSRGSSFAMKYIKNVRLSFLHHLSGEWKDKPVPGVRVTYDGIPVVFGPLINSIRQRQHLDYLRVIMTIMFASRALHLGKSPDLDPILEPPKGVSLIPDKVARSFWIRLGYKSADSKPRALDFKKWHFTTKSGPNGHALWTCLADLSVIPLNLVDSIRIVGGPSLSEKIDQLYQMLPTLSAVLPCRGRIFRKLSFFPDKEDKVRVIAVGDYFSQAALAPLHRYLFKVLKKIPQDCTFDQAGFKEKIIGWQVFYSIDLTAATDRFPITQISSLLKQHLPEDYVDAWKDIMIGYPFEFRGPTETKFVSYGTGNPMGFYSSWASFAVAHHFVMFYCCQLTKINWRTAPYVLLGDDILIGDHNLAKTYQEVITSLGVEFSPLKTHISPNFCEFAKRYMLNGEEITPFPVSSIKESAKRYYLLVNTLEEATRRGWATLNGIPSAIEGFYETVFPRKRTFRARIEEQSFICELIMKVMRGFKYATNSWGFNRYQAIEPYIALTEISRKLNLPLVIAPEEGIGILSNVAVEAFASSNPVNMDNEKDRKGYPLGALAENLVIYITGFMEDPSKVAFIEWISSIPHLHCYGQIEESYIQISKEAYRIDTTGGGEWPLLMKTMALPLDDRIFVQRSSHLISRASAIIGKQLKERFQLLWEFYPHMRDVKYLSENKIPK